ncbi:hypothetical protein WN51_08033 [Melipona quadrifasciata]|uniref:Uncharacterized protein n=1 Tax=Melipona quadrifasciata TaxID=166423 RepID=A0A0M8ZNZ0_9HYME|nr:hypothetical protein WN51_08033 [Melipona quadrifasciata]
MWVTNRGNDEENWRKQRARQFQMDLLFNSIEHSDFNAKYSYNFICRLLRYLNPSSIGILLIIKQLIYLLEVQE